jgi:hypothetical protein
MATETTEQIVREAPEIEAIKLGLLESAKQLADKPVTIPAQQIAGLSPLQMAAFGAAEQGIGGFQPYLTEAGYTLGDAQTALGGIMAGATPYQQEAAFGLRQAAEGIPAQITASQLGMQGAIGSAQQAAERANLGTALLGQQAIPQFGESTQRGIGAYEQMLANLAGTTGQFDPASIAQYQSPYEDLAVQQALSDIARQGQLQREQIGAQAVGAGAFGGSRQAVAEQELGRNVLEQQARTAAQMRSAGFQNASQMAQQAFEAQQARGQQAAQLGGQMGLSTAQIQAANAQALAQTGLNIEQLASQTGLSAAQLAGQLSGQAGQLGVSGQQLQSQISQGLGGLGTDYGQLGLQQGEALGTLGLRQASLGQQQQQLGQQEAGFLFDIGQKQQQQQQAELEAARQTQLQAAYEPYQRLGFLSDIYKGAPSTQMAVTAGTTPETSTGEKILGLGIAGLSAAAGASKAGLF